MRKLVEVKGAFFAFALVSLFFFGCGGGVGDVTTGSVSSTGTRISLYWPDGYSYDQADGAITIPSGELNSTLPAYVTGMTLTISGEGIDPPVTLNVPLDTLTVNFAVTPGIRTFTILISTNISGLSFTASQTIDLVAGAQVNLDFDLKINAPPVVSSVTVSDSTPQTKAGISVSCNATDPDDNPITYSWSYSGARGRFSGSGATVGFTATSGGSITITCKASDGKGGEGEGSVTITANTPPVVNSVTASDTSPVVGDTITLTCTASDPDGDRLSYSWSDGLGSGSQVSYTVTSAGSKTFTCTVSDGNGGTDSGSVTINGEPVTSTRKLIKGLFADANLQTCVDALATTNGWTYADEVTGYISPCTSKGIVSLSGMEYLTNIIGVNFNSNSIVNLGPLSGLTGLTNLLLKNNSITDVSPLSGLTNLTNLALNNNSIVDVSPLASLTKLTALELNSNSIGGQGVGKVDSLLPLSISQVYLFSNITMSCGEANTLICGAGNTVVSGACSPASTGLGTNVDINNDGVGSIDTPTNGTNCTNP